MSTISMPVFVVTTCGAADAEGAAGGGSSVRLHPATSRSAKARAQQCAACLHM
jgi:hypothetical protein